MVVSVKWELHVSGKSVDKSGVEIHHKTFYLLWEEQPKHKEMFYKGAT